MSVFGPFCMAHSFVMAGEICSMRHTKHEHQRWWHLCPRLRPSRPTNEFFVFAVEKGPPRKCSQFSRADRFSRCRLHAGIYEPIVNDLGIARRIVKRATTIGQMLFQQAMDWHRNGSQCVYEFLAEREPGGLPRSRAPCVRPALQAVKESRLIDQARLWRPHARLQPARLLCAGRTREAQARRPTLRLVVKPRHAAHYVGTREPAAAISHWPKRS